MDLLQIPFHGSLKRYWRRRQYRRLNNELVMKKRKKLKVIRIPGGSPRFWRIKSIPRLRWKIIASPIKLLTKLKNAYMKMMINLAGNVGYLNTDNTFGGKRIPKARKVDTAYPRNEFEERLVYEIYKNLIASRELYG
ncbi:hypothetical protein DITRI_Ditri13aG0166100 [Diplodiscus trichospermus]